MIGSLMGTLIGLAGSLFIADWLMNKEIEKVKKLIEEANTFKVTLKNEI